MNEVLERKPLSKRRRFEVFKRDGFVCQYCGRHPPDVVLHCDHIQPVCEGGSNDEGNLITACADCNLGKSGVPLQDITPSLSDRADRVSEAEAQIAGYEAIMRERRRRIEDDAQEALNALCECFGRDGIPQADFTSIKRFVGKIGLDATLEAVSIAHGRFPYSYRAAFRYFCGVCWNRVRAAEETHRGSH